MFLADDSVSGPDDWLLAVHLKAGPQALDFLDPLSDRGRLVTLKDLQLDAQDVTNRLWQVTLPHNPWRQIMIITFYLVTRSI